MHIQSKVNVGDLNKMDKTRNDFKIKRALEYQNRDLTPEKIVVNKNYGKKFLGRNDKTSNMNEIFGKSPNKTTILDTSGIGGHYSKTPPRKSITHKIGEVQQNTLTPIMRPNKPMIRVKQDLNKTEISIDNLTIHVY
jgi:hypothetical protein